MAGTYVAVFSCQYGRAFSTTGEETFDLVDDSPLNEVTWGGSRWTRVSDLRRGEAHYVPWTALAM